jgi:thiol:disulfide interchange protein
MAFFALQPGYRTPSGLSDEIKEMAAGQPGWLAWPVSHLATLLSGPGLLAATLLAAAFTITAFGRWLPARAARAVIVLALVLAAFLWLAQGLGGVLTGGSTDPNSGPLLILLALAYWPAAQARPRTQAEAEAEGA